MEYLLDLDVKGFIQGTKQAGDSIDRELGQKSTGVFGGIKTKGEAAFGSMQAAAAGAAIGAGTALVTFGVKAVAAFTDSALAAGKFADATGLSTEEASKWIALADDYGVSGEAIQGSFLRLNKAIGDGGPIVEKYGIELQKTADGADDVNGTMLEAIRTIGRIKDPTERATAAQATFGRSYAEVAEIVLGDSAKIKAAFESTSDAQIFNEDEVRKAREYRAAMDQLSEVLGDLSLTMGQTLVPVLTQVADATTSVDESLGFLGGTSQILSDGLSYALGGSLGLTRNQLDRVKEGADDASVSMDDFERAARGPARAQRDLTIVTDDVADSFDGQTEEVKTAAEQLSEYRNRTNDAMGVLEGAPGTIDEVNAALAEQAKQAADAAGKVDDVADSIEDVTEAFADLKDEMSDRSAWLDVEDAISDYDQAIRDVIEADTEFGRGSVESAAASRDAERALIDRTNAVIDYLVEVEGVPPEKLTEIRVLLQQDKLDEAEAIIENLARHRTMILDIQTRINNAASSDFALDPVSQLPSTPARITQGTTYGSGITIQSGAITMTGTKATPEEVVEAIANYVRRNGPI
ncbi:MAG: hypothetical protein ABIO83_02140 [Ilumatobacteraceae bacterium]